MEDAMNNSTIKMYFETHRNGFLEDLAKLIAIDSSKGESQAGKPYGEGPAKALAETLKLAKQYGLYTENWDNYLGIIQLNSSQERTLDIFAHLDVVPGGEGWTITNPFQMKIENNKVFGRGTSDDKGPALAVIYALRAIKESGIQLGSNVRLMVGCDEECGSSELEYYFSKTEPAEMTFSPDSEFPVVNTEKGLFYGTLESEYKTAKSGPSIVSLTSGSKGNVIPGEAKAVISNLVLDEIGGIIPKESDDTGVDFMLQINEGLTTITAKGISGHASLPEKANNAATALLQLITKLPIEDKSFSRLCSLQKMFPHGDYHGKSLGLYILDDSTGEITISLNQIRCEKGKLEAVFDGRTPVSANEEKLSIARKTVESAGFDFSEKIQEAHHTSEDTNFIQVLLQIYESFTGEKGKCITAGGSTYVHGINNAVGFGCAVKGVDNHMHGPDEFAEIDTLLLSGMMFTSAILQLCK